MAEALGIFAAGLQISELLGKIVLRSAKLADQLKNAPKELSLKAQALHDFRSLSKLIENAVRQRQPSLANVFINPEELGWVRNLLLRAQSEIDSLGAIIDRLEAKASDRRLDAWWKAVKLLQKGDNITAHLDALQSIKGQIDSSFIRIIVIHQSVHNEATESTLAIISDSQLRTQATLSLIQQLQNVVSRDLQSIGSFYQEFSRQTHNMHQGLNNGLTLVQDSTNNIEAILHKMEDSLTSKVRQPKTSQPQQAHQGNNLIATKPQISAIPGLCVCQSIRGYETLLALMILFVLILPYNSLPRGLLGLEYCSKQALIPDQQSYSPFKIQEQSDFY